ncbi:MAG: PAS domain S-box protein [Planctomycetaceae bacterium]|nr:PAS domain S-box protein [Planctomycetaceae bacterium]
MTPEPHLQRHTDLHELSRCEGPRPISEGPVGPQPVATAERSEALHTTPEELHAAVEHQDQLHRELRASRIAIEAERRRFRELFEFAPDGYLVTDLFGVIREANQSAAGLLNIPQPFLPGKPLALLVVDADRPAFRNRLNSLHQATGFAEFDVRLRPRRRAPLDVSIRVSVVYDTFGRPSALRWAIRDISARKRAEEEVRALNATLESRVAERTEQLKAELQAVERLLIKAHGASEAEAEGRLFEDLVQMVDAIVWKADAATGRYTFVSRRAEELLGFPADRWLDDPQLWADRLHLEDREWAIGQRQRLLAEGRSQESEYRLVTADGRTVWFRESVRILKDDEGRPRELYGLMVNISRRKKVERQLYAAKSELATQLDDMTYLYELGQRLSECLDLGPILQEVLAAATALLGTDQGAVRFHEPGRDTHEIVASVGLPEEFLQADSQRADAASACDAAVATRAPVVVEDIELEPEYATYAPIARLGGFRGAFCHPLITAGGELVGTLTAFFREPHRPSPRQVRLVGLYTQQAANIIFNSRLHEAFEGSDRREKESLAIVARELLEPLDAIRDATRVLRTVARPDDAELVRARDEIEGQVRHMAQLVDDLLDSTRLRQATADRFTEPVALAEVASQASRPPGR